MLLHLGVRRRHRARWAWISNRSQVDILNTCLWLSGTAAVPGITAVMDVLALVLSLEWVLWHLLLSTSPCEGECLLLGHHNPGSQNCLQSLLGGLSLKGRTVMSRERWAALRRAQSHEPRSRGAPQHQCVRPLSAANPKKTLTPRQSKVGIFTLNQNRTQEALQLLLFPRTEFRETKADESRSLEDRRPRAGVSLQPLLLVFVLQGGVQ